MSWRTGVPWFAHSVLLLAPSAIETFEIRAYDGSGNNLESPEWGASNQPQIRAVVEADYVDGVSATPGDDRPTAREVTTEVFVSAPSVLAPESALFAAWGQLMTYDIFLNEDNASEPYSVPCDDGGGFVDVWCPEGEASEDIPFYRSDWSFSSGSSARTPINYASAYLDLDFLYGRTEEEALSLRSMEDGLMNISGQGIPHRNPDGTWKMADQRPASFPVTFALHSMLLLEHNRCTKKVAPYLGFEGDEDIYQACRAWTIAVYQHVIENDFSIRILEATPASRTLQDNSTSASARRSRRSLLTSGTYNSELNAGADVFVTTVGAAAFEAAIPPFLRMMDEGFVPLPEDMVELTEAAEDLEGLVERNGLGAILRGAVLGASLQVDSHFASAVSTLSPLYKLPVDAVQRGRDHGIPTYNDAREAYGLPRASSFSQVTEDPDVEGLLEAAYGGDMDLLDSVTGALAEGSNASAQGILGDLLREAWFDQLYRLLMGDRLWHNHAEPIEDVESTTLYAVLGRTVNVTDVPSSVFTTPEFTVCISNCSSDMPMENEFELSDGFVLGWEVRDDDGTAYTLRAKNIEDRGMLGIGFGGTEMIRAQDYVICEVLDESTAECIDRQSISSRSVPPPDDENSILEVENVSIVGEWTSVTFLRYTSDLDDQDYIVANDVDEGVKTDVIYAYREGPGIGQHPNENRGAASIDFASGSLSTVCEDDSDFFLLHGAFMLFAWMVVAPLGIFFARYQKGMEIWGKEWHEMHAELMVVAAEAVLPLSITAIVTAGPPHTSEHARWGYYMMIAVVLQIASGWLRTQGLEGKHCNFGLLHRVNKHFHIWCGHFAYLAGAIQCYRGVELVAATDSLIFSAVDVEFELGNFGVVYNYVFPAWVGVLAFCFIVFETRKQIRRFNMKGVANVCCIDIVNPEFVPEAQGKKTEQAEGSSRLIPRVEGLPLYTLEEFNDKVLNGQAWVIVDGAILDVSAFAGRHPGGARLIRNAMGTNITNQLLGQEIFVDPRHTRLSPHTHTTSAWEIVRSMVIGYIDNGNNEHEEDEGEDEANKGDGNDSGRRRRQIGKDAGKGLDVDEKSRSSRAKKSRARSTRASKHQKNEAAVGNEEAGGKDTSKTSGDEKSFTTDPPAVDAGDDKPDTMMDSSTMQKKRVFLSATTLVVGEWAKKAKHLKTFTVVPVKGPHGGSSALSSHGSHDSQMDPDSIERMASLKVILNSFHVCPLIFWERIDHGADRPVYKYVFSCPGDARELPKAIAGVCFFNLRIVRQDGESLVQRSYNAFPVRVSRRGKEAATGEASSRSRTTPMKDLSVVPASETDDGELCIEMRIRLYPDGAMSKLLDQLVKDMDNPAVQLQGPFMIERVTPPPAHRNVIMIAAGTGVNPMLQLIREYRSFSRASGDSSGREAPRLVLLWQSGSEADLYGLDDIRKLEAESGGELEVLVLVSGDTQRRTYVAGGYEGRKAKKIIRRPPVTPTVEVEATEGERPGATTATATAVRQGEEKVTSLANERISVSTHELYHDQSSQDESLVISRENSWVSQGTSRGERSLVISRESSMASRTFSVEHPDSSRSFGGAHRVVSAKSRGLASRVSRSDSNHSFLGRDGAGSGVSTISEDESVEISSSDEDDVPSRRKKGSNGSKATTVSALHGEGEEARFTFFQRLPEALEAAEEDEAPDEIAGESASGRQLEAGKSPTSTSPIELAEPVRVAPNRPEGLLFPTSESKNAQGPRNSFGNLQRGKLTIDQLEDAFGSTLMETLWALDSLPSSSRKLSLERLSGTDTDAGELQVLLSGPSGFVFHVEAMLDELGVPPECLVLLD